MAAGTKLGLKRSSFFNLSVMCLNAKMENLMTTMLVDIPMLGYSRYLLLVSQAVDFW